MNGDAGRRPAIRHQFLTHLLLHEVIDANCAISRDTKRGSCRMEEDTSDDSV